MEPIADTAWRITSLNLESPGTQDKTNTTSKNKTKNTAIKYLLMAFCYTHRSVLCSDITREAFSCSSKEQIESHRQTLGREGEILKLNRMSASNPSLRSSGNPVEKKAERVLEEPERTVETKKTRS